MFSLTNNGSPRYSFSSHLLYQALSRNQTIAETTNSSDVPSVTILVSPSLQKSSDNNHSCTENLVGPLNVDFKSPSDFSKSIDSKNFPPDYKALTNFTSSHDLTISISSIIIPNCKPKPNSKVAIIICYRDRETQLKFFLLYMLPIFIRQNLEFKIYVIEQAGNTIFNRAKLFNVGYEIAKSEYKWDCYTFHDVDLILENDKMSYRCDKQNPRHLSVAVSTFNYRLPYEGIFGGITQMTGAIFETVNGYPNNFWGWGGEDDVMYSRVKRFYDIKRPPKELARYKMYTHVHEKSNAKNPKRVQMLKEENRNRTLQKINGLSNLEYKVLSRQLKDTFEIISVDVGHP